MAYLETQRLLFRAHEAGDEAAFVAMQTDPEVRRWVGGRVWTTGEAVERFRDSFLGRPAGPNDLCATVLKAEGSYIGYCGLRWRRGRGGKPQGTGELAFYLARPYWGRGLATEAGAAFVDLAFGNLGLLRLRADFEAGNEASRRVLEKLGFVHSSQSEAPPRVFDRYVLSQADWQAAHQDQSPSTASR